MKKSLKYKRIRFRKLRKAPPGSAPGLFNISEESLKPEVKVHAFNSDVLKVTEMNTVSSIRQYMGADENLTYWIEIKGLGDKQFFEELAAAFNIHRLEMEDVLSGHQRPKVEESDDHLFLVSRFIGYGPDEEISDDQVSVFLFRNHVISIQDNTNDYFQPVKDRLEQNKGIIRKSGCSYLGYALMDSIVDNYFPFLEKMGTYLDDLEDNLLTNPDRYSLQNIQNSKRKLILFRRAAWAEREKLNELMRNQSPLFSDTARRYLRDTYDHTIQVMDIIDSYREITASLMDIYLSSVSNRMNKVMKVLTIISTIFIPLTFIVGVYGMNFVYRDELTGEVYKWNMPELHAPYGYAAVLGAMVIIVIGQIYFFHKKGWLGKDSQ